MCEDDATLLFNAASATQALKENVPGKSRKQACQEVEQLLDELQALEQRQLHGAGLLLHDMATDYGIAIVEDEEEIAALRLAIGILHPRTNRDRSGLLPSQQNDLQSTSTITCERAVLLLQAMANKVVPSLRTEMRLLH